MVLEICQEAELTGIEGDVTAHRGSIGKIVLPVAGRDRICRRRLAEVADHVEGLAVCRTGYGLHCR